jgi:diguanylate cyclase (GGDEF)-like protein
MQDPIVIPASPAAESTAIHAEEDDPGRAPEIVALACQNTGTLSASFDSEGFICQGVGIMSTRGTSRHRLRRLKSTAAGEQVTDIASDPDVWLDLDRASSIADQKASDADQKASFSDQQCADLEQRASDRDQAAADREAEVFHGTAAQSIFDASSAVRADTAITREAAAATRSATTHDRALEATRRDETARMRDATANSRDLEADTRDRLVVSQIEELLTRCHPADPASRVLQATLESMLAAAADREQAARDRRRAAADRAQAATDRLHARVELRGAQYDGLTGAYSRDFGRVILQHAVDRAHRSSEPLVLAFVDIDGLKEVNDGAGHAAGDVLLKSVVGVLLAKLRTYDVIVRIGGDEFVCGLTNTELSAAWQRFEEIRTAIATGPAAGSISVGLASLRAGETIDDLTKRADLAMYSERQAGPETAARPP